MIGIRTQVFRMVGADVSTALCSLHIFILLFPIYHPTFFSLRSSFFKKMGQSRPLFVYSRLFYTIQIKYILIKALMVCLGLEPGAAGWKTQTNPLSYGGTPLVDGSNLSKDTKPRSVIWRHFKRVPFQLSSEAGNKIH